MMGQASTTGTTTGEATRGNAKMGQTMAGQAGADEPMAGRLPADPPIVSVRRLAKRFGDIRALDGVSLDIGPGRIVGLLGANGSGKSTLLRSIIGLYLPDSGTCTTMGVEAKKLGAKEFLRIGYVHQEGELLDWLSVRQLIRYVAAYYPGWNVALEERYVREFEVPLGSRVGTLSPGQRQQLAILLAIGFEPDFLILDEPAASMDSLARMRFLDILLEIIQNPSRTILISSHILTDVEKIVDHVLVLDKGRLLRDCAFDDLKEEFRRIKVTALGGALPEALPFAGVIEERRDGAQAVLTLARAARDETDRLAEEAGWEVEDLPLPLEELYRLVVTEGRGTTAGKQGH
jgi:ABC-2 type transport system ATP-binding protein